MKIENKITINASLTDVWDAFTNPALLPQWLKGFKSIKPISGKHLERGSKNEMIFEERGKEMTFIETVTDVVPGKSYEFTISHEKLSCKTSTILTAIGTETELVQSSDYLVHSFWLKLMFPMMKRSLHKNVQQSLGRLRDLIESGPSGTDS